jgi:hypothetical protein
MGKCSDNKGFSLVEIIIALAIIMVVSGSIISFLLAGSNSYSSVITSTDLQKEAQLVMNQISDIVISADQKVAFVGSTNTLEVTNEDSKYEISYNPTEKKLYYKKSNYGISTRTYELQEEVPMAENVTSFSADVVKENGVSKVKVKISFENNSKSYTKEEIITLRNEVK